MSAPTYSASAGPMVAVETRVRQLIIERIAVLLGDVGLQELLISRVDDLRQGSQDRWKADFLSWCKRINERGLRVMASYPIDEGQLPAIGIIQASASEDASLQVCGDVWRRTSELVGTLDAADPTSSAVYDHIELATGWTSDIQVSAWSTGPEEAVFLHTIARWALHSGKEQLTDIGMRDATLSESGFEPTSNPLYPHVPFVPLISFRLAYTYRHREVTGPQKHRVTVLPCSVINPS